jgi:hypothetical protein
MPVQPLEDCDQESPPSMLERMAPSLLIAQQSDVLGQETPVRKVIPLGRLCAVHVVPPSVVVITAAGASSLGFWAPTSTQSKSLAHEMAKPLKALGTV